MSRIIARIPLTEIAIIGFWRSGASFEEISHITYEPIPFIKKVITRYAYLHDLKLKISDTGKLIWD